MDSVIPVTCQGMEVVLESSIWVNHLLEVEMKTSGNTILIAGGATGIGLSLAGVF
jgi:hypothetical protein